MSLIEDLTLGQKSLSNYVSTSTIPPIIIIIIIIIIITLKNQSV